MPRPTRPIEGVEVIDDQEIEVIDKDYTKIAEDENFMHETVEVMLHASTDENAPTHVILSVNGVNQPLFPGVTTPMKRKFVEVLARCKATHYSQPQQDLSNPERSNQMVGRTAHAYPFSVVRDTNPRGGMWLAKVMAEPA